jgi:hypothetical protein
MKPINLKKMTESEILAWANLDKKRWEEKSENLYNEIMNDPDLSQEFKDDYKRLKEEGEKENERQKIEDEKEKLANLGKKIIGYNPTTFKPIYED